MGSLLPLIIQLFSGAVGGNVAGSLLKNSSLGTLWNTVAGLVGGGLGGQILGMAGIGVGANGTLNVMDILSNVAASGVGGGVLLVIIGMIKKMMK